MNDEDRTIIADDGRVLFDLPIHSLPPINHSITPADIVGEYEAESFVDCRELTALIKVRLALGDDVSAQDLAGLTVPDKFLFAGWCIDVWPREGDDPDVAWQNKYASLRREQAAELAVRRELRDRKIGVKNWATKPSDMARRSGIAFFVERSSQRERLPGVEAKARELCAAAGRDPDEIPLPLCDASSGGWPDFVVPAMKALGLSDADIGPEWVEFRKAKPD